MSSTLELGLRLCFEEDLHLHREIHSILPDMLARIRFRHAEELKNRLGDVLSEDIIVALLQYSLRLQFKGQRIFGQLENLFLIH